ncbi:MAG: hypothetical protein U0359_17470 [Byssovorax sp.]
MSRPRPTRWEILRLAAVVVFFTAAPTAGDIGSSCQPEDELDPTKFFTEKQDTDCERCNECQISTKACQRSCDVGLAVRDFPAGCVPLVHDGEVCVDALRAASCADYESFMADDGATAPTECQFCPLRADAGPTDAGATE